MVAREAFNPDIRPDADDSPLVAAAGVLLPEADNVIYPYFKNHRAIVS